MLQFLPFVSRLEAGFWHELGRRKLECFKLSEAQQELHGSFSNSMSVYMRHVSCSRLGEGVACWDYVRTCVVCMASYDSLDHRENKGTSSIVLLYRRAGSLYRQGSKEHMYMWFKGTHVYVVQRNTCICSSTEY